MAKLTRKVQLIIEMTEDEAQWLQGVMQNPVHGSSVLSELHGDKEMRRKFWESLTGINTPEIQGLDEAYDQYKAIESGDLKIERTK